MSYIVSSECEYREVGCQRTHFGERVTAEGVSSRALRNGARGRSCSSAGDGGACSCGREEPSGGRCADRSCALRHGECAQREGDDRKENGRNASEHFVNVMRNGVKCNCETDVGAEAGEESCSCRILFMSLFSVWASVVEKRFSGVCGQIDDLSPPSVV